MYAHLRRRQIGGWLDGRQRRGVNQRPDNTRNRSAINIAVFVAKIRPCNFKVPRIAVNSLRISERRFCRWQSHLRQRASFCPRVICLISICVLTGGILRARNLNLDTISTVSLMINRDARCSDSEEKPNNRLRNRGTKTVFEPPSLSPEKSLSQRSFFSRTKSLDAKRLDGKKERH